MFYTRMRIDGSGFEKERNLMTWTTALDGGGSVAADGKGNVYVVWHAAPKDSPKGENVRGVFVATSHRWRQDVREGENHQHQERHVRLLRVEKFCGCEGANCTRCIAARRSL